MTKKPCVSDIVLLFSKPILKASLGVSMACLIGVATLLAAESIDGLFKLPLYFSLLLAFWAAPGYFACLYAERYTEECSSSVACMISGMSALACVHFAGVLLANADTIVRYIAIAKATV